MLVHVCRGESPGTLALVAVAAPAGCCMKLGPLARCARGVLGGWLTWGLACLMPATHSVAQVTAFE